MSTSLHIHTISIFLIISLFTSILSIINMASKLSSIFLIRRSYAVAAENVKAVQPAVSVVGKMREVSSMEKKEVFWMRDPKSGNWIPETHFDDAVDAAELRDKLLPKKN